MPKIDTPITTNSASIQRLLDTNVPTVLVLHNSQRLPTNFENQMKALAKQHTGDLLIAKANTTENRDLIQQYDLPSGILALRGSEELARSRTLNTDTLENYAAYLLGETEELATEPVADAPTRPVKVTTSTFSEQVLNSATPVLVDFWAEWCGPCHMIAPALDNLASEYAGRVTIAKVNVDENSQLANRYGIRGIPNLKLFKDGKIVDEVVGAAPEQALRAFLNQHV